MKRIIYTLAALVATATLFSCGTKTENIKLASEQDSLSWAMGMSLARTAKSGLYQFDEKLVRKAFESSLRGEKQPLTEEDYSAACQALAVLSFKQQREQIATANKEADGRQQQLFDKLVAENKNIQKAEEGYYYEVLTPGHGANAKVGQRIEFDFKGINMVSGEVIEQTYGKREPVVHVLGRPMFQGLLLGMQLMNAGSKYRFYFPHQLVTGANGIPEHTPVIYEVELHKIH
ncbi:MAG: FKBP-type peptidyl-prolyl cis-trans isomerase [Bacteroidales bacterium]|nr:FKBP-type peptidyl-prolyl cis-trans isomerase [Bacteroidales bacterium]